MIKEILVYPNEILRKMSEPVNEQEVLEWQEFFDDLAETMKDKDGLGLAAPQIGVNKRIIAVQTARGAEIFVNPVIAKRSFFKENDEEGCLSVPGIYGIVRRHKKIKVEAIDRSGKKQTFMARGLFARVLQHEIDHLDGVLFIEQALKITRQNG